jgi:hypothetical protein
VALSTVLDDDRAMAAPSSDGDESEDILVRKIWGCHMVIYHMMLI